MNFGEHLRYVIRAHEENALSQQHAVRRWDMKTPYSMHPIWCAMTLLAETSLSETVREHGYLALLYHDLLEDTTARLPEDLPERVCYLVREMTFPGGSEQEMEEIWGKEPEVKLLKLYDKVSNLLDSVWMGEDRFQRYRSYTKKLLEEVETAYGELNIVKLARAVIEK